MYSKWWCVKLVSFPGFDAALFPAYTTVSISTASMSVAFAQGFNLKYVELKQPA